MYSTPKLNNDFDRYDEPRLHMDRLLKAHLIEFDISLRILIPLEKAGIKTLGELVQRRKADLRKISQLGQISVERLENFLTYHGLSLSK